MYSQYTKGVVQINEVTIHVKSENRTDMDLIGRQVTAKAKTSFLRAGGHAGAAFAAGFIKTITLGQVGSGFAMAATKLKPQMAHIGGTLGVALAAGIVVKLASSLSALLAGALGGGALAGPLIYLWKTQEKAVERLKKRATEFMDVISRPVKIPFLRSLEKVGDRLEEWGPKLSKALKPLAKELPGFVEGALRGIENFASEIGKKMPSITKGFREWGKELPGIGRALGRMISNWVEDGPALADGIKDTAGSMRDLADAVGAVGRGFRSFNRTNEGFKDRIEGQRSMILKWRIKMLEAIHTVLSAWALINPRMKKVRDSVGDMLADARKEARKTADEINKKNIKPKIKADIRELQDKVRNAKQRLKETHNQKTQAKIRAEISHLQAMVRIAKASLASIRNRTVTITAFYQSRGTGPTSAGRLATGGIVGAQGANRAAGGGPRSNRVLVGEQGPEIVDLPTGSHVNSNPDSRRMMANSGRGDITINVMAPNYVGTPSDLLKALVDAKRRGQLDVILR